MGYAFSGPYSHKGCYAYNSGSNQGKAFFGTGGSEEDMKKELPENRYRPRNYDCAAVECSMAASTRFKVNSCSSSSKFSADFKCMNAFVGTVTKFSYLHRVSKQQYWNKDIRLEFSDGSKQSYQLKAESGVVQTFTLSKPVTTTFVKIVVVSHYSKNNNGAREIEFFG